MNRCCLLILLLLSYHSAFGQTSADYAVQITATVQPSPPLIVLSWKSVPGATSYDIYKKAKGDTAWGPQLMSLSPTDTVFKDASIIVDSAYEYRLVTKGSPVATGHIYAGINAPAIHHRGRLLLLVDSTFVDSCAANLSLLQKDLRGDGWEVVRYNIPRPTPDSIIKALIKLQHQFFPSTNAVLIVGHLAVPYSGVIYPDGHIEHRGAWPADVYYADMDDPWTDTSANITALRPENTNLPGDGKWDRSALSSPLELQVSRIDFYNMPAFGKTEVQLMNSYLTRAHAYKMDSIVVAKRALIDDNFGAFGGEAFAANGWRNYPTLVGKNNIHELDLITTLRDSSYQWAYGCGGGAYTGSGGIGYTPDFAADSINAIFVQLFGSYFGDWDNQNNFLRAPLCAESPALTSCWAGRPNWFFHHMALGENIGYSARLTQSNLNSLYTPANASTPSRVHAALMGDLSLRTDYIKPITNFSVAHLNDSSIILTWNPSPDPAVSGYYVYRSISEFGHYQQISSLVPNTTFNDISLASGVYYYMVRPVKLQSTPSGNYYNLGIGTTDSITFFNTTVVNRLIKEENITVFPNPARNILNVLITSPESTDLTLTLIDMNGKQILSRIHHVIPGKNNFTFQIGTLPTGAYAVLVKSRQSAISKTWIKVD
jgi:hypothetical protein